ncbi:ESX secretion-associated protein EspG [Nocardia miyunensis]|uniref:ESX secretion-associated protein EspG n=1 Tax=Nocardia miyunensis TaxID=282684 RepID=UPI00083706FA|nr:ESX secretion-associated protein EspG [Nocardia miyunensis]
MAEWAWSPEDFASLWYSDANDRIPNILRYTPHLPYWDEFNANKAAVRQQYDEGELERIQLAIDTLTNSDMRISILGSTTKYPGSCGIQYEYRIIGARNIYHAAILRQFTRGKVEGKIQLRLCRPENLPARLVATIPARKAGTQPPIMVHRADIRDARPTNRGNSPAERYRRMLAGQGDGSGWARLQVGSFNASPQPTNTVQWYDLSDGRYLKLLQDEHINVRPATPQDLTSRFSAWIERAMQRMHEDEFKEGW